MVFERDPYPLHKLNGQKRQKNNIRIPGPVYARVRYRGLRRYSEDDIVFLNSGKTIWLIKQATGRACFDHDTDTILYLKISSQP